MRTSELITKVIFDYKSLELNGHNLNQLVVNRKNLVCYCYDFGREVSQFKIDFDAAYGQRKIAFYREKNEHIKEGVSKAETIAEVCISELRTKEKQLEGLYSGSKIILNQANEVLKAMQQDIAMLKSELKEG